MSLTESIEARLRERLQITEMLLRDDSAAHHGHAGSAAGGGHFELLIVSPDFEGKSRVSRHRLVYDALSDWMPARIHALSIDARTPSEFVS
ncbi:BolA Stress-induced morphogen (activity unknown) [Burkholderiales bacterium]|jgi:BolA protein